MTRDITSRPTSDVRVKLKRSKFGQTKFNFSPGPGLWSLVLGPFGPDLGPDLDLTWDLDLDLSLRIGVRKAFYNSFSIFKNFMKTCKKENTKYHEYIMLTSLH